MDRFNLIGLTLREDIGKERRLALCKFDARRFVINIGLVNKNSKHIEKYLDTESHLSPVKAPLAPHEYGLVVIDFVSNQILDNSHYCIMGEFNASWQELICYEFGHSLGGVSDIEQKLGESEYEGNRFNSFLKAGRISYGRCARFTCDDSGEEVIEYKKVDLHNVDLQRFGGKVLWEKLNLVCGQRIGESILIKTGWKRKRDYTLFEVSHIGVDLSPFEVTRYKDGELYQMKQKIKDLGFNISPREEKVWINFLEKK
jgi:hypothetical protein